MLQKTFTMWRRETARTLFQKETDLCFDRVFKKYGIDRPILCIKKMKTLWGNCTPNKCKITLNECIYQHFQYLLPIQGYRLKVHRNFRVLPQKYTTGYQQTRLQRLRLKDL